MPFWEALQEKVPKIEDFMSEFAIIKTGYHGGQFEGNECNVVLNNLDRLRDYVPNHFHEYVDTLEAFQDVKSGCFGYKLAPDYFKRIRTFELKMVILRIKFKVSVLLKCHVVFEHVQQVILETGRAIGQDSE